ncbi:small subunit ribosomal protein S9e [Angomonas deanei]|nr:small subunit ribosomal protein S9e [Angomonas deanei]|eukprot:EPY38705.1 small subunit ribosomal protein S9e [Angomonas deanei]
MRRCHEYGFLEEEKDKLDYVLSLQVTDILERRLQTIVFKAGIAKSVHHARVLVQQRHIAVAKQIVTIPSFMVRISSERLIAFADASPYGNGRLGRVRRVRRNQQKKAAAGGDAEDE